MYHPICRQLFVSEAHNIAKARKKASTIRALCNILLLPLASRDCYGKLNFCLTLRVKSLIFCVHGGREDFLRLCKRAVVICTISAPPIVLLNYLRRIQRRLRRIFHDFINIYFRTEGA